MNITTYNEFCFIIWHYTPIAYDLHLKGKLTSTNSKIGTSPLFYFSPNHTESKVHNWHMENYQPYYQLDDVKIKDGWTPPPYKEQFKNDKFVYDKPILTINNKSTIEWERGLFNYFNLESLDRIFEEFSEDYQIIYIRPPHGDTQSYQHDQGVKTMDIGDIQLIKEKYPNIITIEDLITENPDLSYNELQMSVLANSDRHIAAAGGDAAIAAYFGGDLLIYRNKSAPSTNRGVWRTGSYLRLFSGSNVIGCDTYDDVLKQARSLWK